MSALRNFDPLGIGLDSEPADIRGLATADQNRLIVSQIRVDGTWVIMSRYGDDEWKLAGGTTNLPESSKTLHFKNVPESYRSTMKAVMYRYLRRGREGQVRPKLRTVRGLFKYSLPFLHHLQKLHVKQFSEVTPMVCAAYIELCSNTPLPRTKGTVGKLLGDRTLQQRFLAVEGLYELSQYTADPIPRHPWPDTSHTRLANLTGENDPRRSGSRTPMMPDDVFTTLFQGAWSIVERAHDLLDLRDDLDGAVRSKARPFRSIREAIDRQLGVFGRVGGLKEFHKTLTDVRTACYIVIASLSGCRNHELAFVQSDGWHSTQGDQGEVYWWMHSQLWPPGRKCIDSSGLDVHLLPGPSSSKHPSLTRLLRGPFPSSSNCT